jgi:hypothetical protein
MAADMPRVWPLLSFFAVGLAQQPMLVGITLPLYSVHLAAGAPPLGAWDALATATCVCGLLLASRADDQLRAYVLANHRLATQGKPPVPVRATPDTWCFSNTAAVDHAPRVTSVRLSGVPRLHQAPGWRRHRTPLVSQRRPHH